MAGERLITVARSLYRFYLYSVVIILLIALTGITGSALGAVLSTVLSTMLASGPNAGPSGSYVVQTVSLAVAMWIVTLILGGLHYWLIRRDMRTDPHAGAGPVRAFYLNIPAAFAALLAVGLGASALSNIGQYWSSIASPLAGAVVTTGFVLLLQWERSRTQPAPGAALVFQRLHLYFTRLFMVPIGMAFWMGAIALTVQYLTFQILSLSPCAVGNYPVSDGCYLDQTYTAGHVAGAWAAAAWCLGAWLFYGYLGRKDRVSVPRQVALMLGLAYAMFITVMGLEDGLELLMRWSLRREVALADILGLYHQFGFIAAVTFGVLLLAAYWRVYTQSSRQLGDGMRAAELVRLGVVALVPAIPFWTGVQLVLAQIFERISPDPREGYAVQTPHILAVVIAGAMYVPLALYFRSRTRAEGVTWPRRAFVLALLAGGTVTAAISAVILAQALVTAALGAALTNWQQQARSAAATLIVGLALCAIYGVQTVRERYLAPAPSSTASTASPSAPHETATAAPTTQGTTDEDIEAILDRLLAGELSRDQAAERIRQATSRRT